MFNTFTYYVYLANLANMGVSRNLIRLWHGNNFPSVPNKNYISIQKDDKQWEEVTSD